MSRLIDKDAAVKDLLADPVGAQLAAKNNVDGWLGQREEIPAIPISWIEAYADWLTQIPAPFAANDERSIRAMLTKWRTNPELKQIGCKDACDL